METIVKQRRALIVDDEKTIVEILSNYLKDEGYLVTGAYDGAEALEKALSEPFDVILLDLNLPTVSGIEVFKQIRKTSDVPVLMVTSRDESVDRIVGLELGADDYIAKPFNPREVVARVKNIVRRTERRARDRPHRTRGEAGGKAAQAHADGVSHPRRPFTERRSSSHPLATPRQNQLRFDRRLRSDPRQAHREPAQ